jgi:uncharacterized SAM-binding protein YcdF (DUF218 family)
MDTLIWSATNLIASMILPPGVFCLLLAAGLIWSKKHRWARWLAAVSLVAFTLLTLKVVAYQLVAPFEARWPPLDLKVVKNLTPEQAMIVVLGGGRTLGALEYKERETLSSGSLRRTVFAAQLAARTGLPLAVSGGSPNGGALGEAQLMRNLLEDGFKQRVSLVEDKSFDTRQSAIYIAKALAGGKVRTVVLVTDVLHMPRAARAFEAAGLKVVPAPVYFLASAPLNVTDFVPTVDGLGLSQYALHEWVGAAWYAMRRMIGG